MARIRSIKPELPQSESMGNVSRNARLTFILLWTLSDDEGRLRGNSRMLASLLFPYDNDAPGLIDGWLAELEKEDCIARYKIDGQSYVQICNWLIHQKIDKASRSKIPPFVESSRILSNPLERSSEDQGSRIKDQGVVQGSIAPSGAANTADADVDGDIAEENQAIPSCPVGSIINLYHEVMPLNPQVRVLDDARKKSIRARWREAAKLDCKPFGYANREDGMTAWRSFFEVCSQSEFLTGRALAQPGKPPFLADIDFLMSPSGFKKCLENKYHREAS